MQKMLPIKENSGGNMSILTKLTANLQNLII